MPNILKLCPMDLQARTRYIKDALAEEGFPLCGISPAEPLPGEKEHLRTWLAEGQHGEMAYLARNLDKRTDPCLLAPGARSVISVAMPCFPAREQEAGAPRVARYALGKDYHPIIRNKLSGLLRTLQSLFPEVQGRAFTDSAPVLERYWAARSGLGWVGRNGLLLNQHYGSHILLGELILNIELEYDHPVPNRCGNCTRCLEACPTGALTGPARMDARKCLSYLTIEFQGSLEKTDLHGRFFGCDLCQDACPWNRALPACSEPGFQAIPEILKFSPEQWHSLSQDAFADIFGQSPLMRAGLEKLKTHLSYPDKPETS